MIEYKVLKSTVKEVEYELNRLAADGWRVVSSNTLSGASLTVNSSPIIVILERKA